jgi:hypothetical protein
MKKQSIIILALITCINTSFWAQGLILDVSVGTSLQDKLSNNVALRYQLNPRFRLGVEVQGAIPKYRFIDAKPIREGYAFKFLVPTTTRLYEKGQLRLDLIATAGVRRQGVLDPDKNDTRDSLLRSTAAILNSGLIVTIHVNERFSLQSGIMVPFVWQLKPTSSFEALHGPMIVGGAHLKTSEKTTLFFNSQVGAAFGANGDTYKYSWALFGGVRYCFDALLSDHIIEPTFSF